MTTTTPKTPTTEPTASPPSGDVVLPPEIRQPLVKPTPWMKFIGVLLIILSGFIVLVGLAFVSGISFMGDIFDQTGFGAPVAVFFGLIYAGIGVIYFFPGFYLVKAGSSLRMFKETNTGSSLINALQFQSRYWKFIGVLCIVSLALMALSIVVGIIGMALAAL